MFYDGSMLQRCRRLRLLLLGACLATVAWRIQALAFPREASDLSEEHRLTALETEMKAVMAGLEEVKQHDWYVMIGLLGLLGDRGLSIYKGAKK